MRISDSPSPNRGENVEPAKDAGPNQQENSAAARPQDEATVSPVAQAVSKVLEDDDAKVQNLRAQYRDGTYQVDAGKLSAKIVDEQLSE